MFGEPGHRRRIRETAITKTIPQLATISVELLGPIATIRLNRPDRANAINEPMWQELRGAFAWADAASEVRVVVLGGDGRNFCSGIDLSMLASVDARLAQPDPARRHEGLRRLILDLQDCLSAVERCRKPVLAAIQGGCIGAGVDLVSCCDARYAAADAQFSVREIDLAMVADVGTLQRLPRLIADGLARELAYTGRDVDAAEAQRCGLVNRVFASPQALHEGVLAIARQIAEKSPLAIRGTKEMLNYGRDHSVADGLDHVATWNAAMLMSADLAEAMRALREKRLPQFGD